MTPRTSFQRLMKRLIAWINGPIHATLGVAGPAPGQAVDRTARKQASATRSPEQARSELARLRANASQRHAPVKIERPTAFDAAVFENFTPSAATAKAMPQEDYPSTVIVPRMAQAVKSAPQDDYPSTVIVPRTTAVAKPTTQDDYPSTVFIPRAAAATKSVPKDDYPSTVFIPRVAPASVAARKMPPQQDYPRTVFVPRSSAAQR
ncbi:hypothetical protein [Variovorax sp. KK3]|uniref:hypothetical protein n=1 Tax=Variovorax sp. KK3 TaxID=1855728 RepID=UPI00097BFB19|nr:hypothetical protein [Variovorax sp. KK3]